MSGYGLDELCVTPSVRKRLLLFLDFLLNDIKKTFDTGLDIRGSKLNIFESRSHHQEEFRHRNFRGCFGVVGVFYFDPPTYNYSVNDARASISPKFKNKTIILGRREYQLYRLEICSNFHIRELKNKITFSLKYVSHGENIIPCYILLLSRCYYSLILSVIEASSVA